MMAKPSSPPNTMDDPLTLAISPAPDESLEQRLLREQEEAQARRVSEEIDEQIKQDRISFKKWQKAVKVLLLGQSESGKSTTIKNFQMKYAYNSWVNERNSWKMVIHLNLVKSVTIILDSLEKEMIASGSRPHSRRRSSTSQIDYDPDTPNTDGEDSSQFEFSEKHRTLRLRLQPMFRIRNDFERRLGSASLEEFDSPLQSVATPLFNQHATLEPTPRRPTEFFITSQKGWKSALDRALPFMSGTKKNAPDDTMEIIAGIGSDIKELWADNVVQAVLKKHKLRLEHASGFFLDDVDRLTSRDYHPTDDDIVRARLRTMGVQEYHFNLNNSLGQEWILAAWYPYFEGINSIIFLAPINCFDQRLAEDRKVNRLEDSLMLWKTVCSSKLLVDVQMILFLNKFDLLDEKLKSGVKFKEYVLNYDDGSNDVKSVARYLKNQFKILFTQASPKKVFYCFMTTVIDTKAMSDTLGVVSDGIIRNALKQTEFL